MKTALRLVIVTSSILGALAVTALSVNPHLLYRSRLLIYLAVIGAWSFLIIFVWLFLRILFAGLRTRWSGD
jgi:hypothetical protein